MARNARVNWSRVARYLPGIFCTAAFIACGAGGKAEGSPGSGSGSGPSAGTGGVATGSGGVVTMGGSTNIMFDAGDPDAVPPGDCVNLQCQQTTCTAGACVEAACEGGTSTSVSGVVYDPAGKVPLYNVIVYVPNTTPPAFTPGVSCDRCGGTILNPVASALTDTHGHFVLEDVPVGANIPLVIQIGKWRRQVTIPTVPRCVDTPLTDTNMTRLPRNKSEGDIPLIAITTGGVDTIECLPRRMGIDDTEFTTDSGEGRIHLFAGMDDGSDKASKAFAASLNGGAALTSATALWGDVEKLKKYDLLIMSCEGGTVDTAKTPAMRQNVYDYASVGGRVLATHWQHIWYSGGPLPVPQTGTWSDRSDPNSPTIGTINQSFPKGKALAEWLVNVGSTDPLGQVTLFDPRDNVQAVNAEYSTEWMTIQNTTAPAPQTAVEYMSFNTPIGVAEDMQCGREVFTDLHVGDASDDNAGEEYPFPSGCAMGDLSTQEKVVEFMLFDLSSCVQNDEVEPEPPPVVK